ncbi:threonine dehydratase [Nocardiopsis sp. Huas11]|uniref:threonine ammonia-lyase n=1 Tax=Nocardiopsis sp. Huas11 TaxID=2183912 RepID=UPI000F1D2673|nr:PLP-dependent lyase/thiolase [Nocardiopsis sp. Huas11]RKS07789.1 threonine dehydratase [Nocardiopsis sp. Huas11]
MMDDTTGAEDLSLDRIAEAAETIDPVFLGTPQYVDEQLAAALGRPVLTKVESLNPLRSFKGRGADFLVRGLPSGETVVCGSGGANFGQAIAYAARSHGLRAEVFVHADASPVKLRRMRTFGARIHPVEGDPKAAAEEYAAQERDRHHVVDGRDAAISEGAGTIGVELAREEDVDTLLLPVGDGALITGVARWMRAHRPGVRIVGVGAAAAPAMAHSWREGRAVPMERRSSFAAGITISAPVPAAVRRVRALVDDMLLVEDRDMAEAMHLAARTLGVLPEPAAVAGLAALTVHDVPGDLVATVLTGANADLDVYAGLGAAPADRVGLSAPAE